MAVAAVLLVNLGASHHLANRAESGIRAHLPDQRRRGADPER